MSNVDPKTAESALQQTMPELEAIAAADVSRCNVAGTTAVEASQQTVEMLEPDLERMREVFVKPPETEAATLVERAMALWAAQKRAETLDPDEGPDRVELFQEAGELKERSIKVLDLVAGDDSKTRKVLEQVRPGFGYRDRADDLTALYPQLDLRRADLVRRELMTEEQITRVGTLAPELLREPTDARAMTEAALLRDRAWTHFQRAWREIRRHLAFLYADDPAGLQRYPNLYSGGRRS